MSDHAKLDEFLGDVKPATQAEMRRALKAELEKRPRKHKGKKAS